MLIAETQTMDRPRSGARGIRHARRAILALLMGAVIVVVTIGALNLRPAAFTVDRRDLVLTVVEQGELVRDVRGLGVLESVRSIWVPAPREAQVKSILLEAGSYVDADTVFLILSNPELELDVIRTEATFRSSEAQLEVERLEYEDSISVAKSEAARIELAYETARQHLSANRSLHRDGLLSDIDLSLSKLEEQAAKRQLDAEGERQTRRQELAKARYTVFEEAVKQAEALYSFRLKQLEDLNIRAGRAGVLVEYKEDLGEGKTVASGEILAKISDPARLRAVLKIPEAQAQELQSGNRVSVRILNQFVEGRVSRVEPIVRNGSVDVDVEFAEKMPKGARPDLSVVGLIEIEHLGDVLYMGRPANAVPHANTTVYRVSKEGTYAIRSPVEIGAITVRSVEVLRGLELGDEVIVSDVTTWLEEERIHLK